MAIVIRGKTIVLVTLLIIGLVFLFFGFAGDSWFKSEPVVSQNSPQEPVTKNEVKDSKKNADASSEPSDPEPKIEDTLIPDAEAKLAEKLNSIQFFEEYRIERDRTRSQQIEILKEITENNNTNEDTREEAQKKLMTMTSNLDKEIELENLIRAKEFKDAVVFIQDTSVTVIVLTKDLTEKDTETISSLVTRSTGVSRENIVIIPKA